MRTEKDCSNEELLEKLEIASHWYDEVHFSQADEDVIAKATDRYATLHNSVLQRMSSVYEPQADDISRVNGELLCKLSDASRENGELHGLLVVACELLEKAESHSFHAEICDWYYNVCICWYGEWVERVHKLLSTIAERKHV